MANKFQELANEINRREWELNSMQETLDKCLEKLNALKETITPEIKEYCENFSPGVLDTIFNEELHTIENAEYLCKVLDDFSDAIYNFVKGVL